MCMEFLQTRCVSADIHFLFMERVHYLDPLQSTRILLGLVQLSDSFYVFFMKLMSAGDVTQLLQMQSIEQVTHHTRLRYTLPKKADTGKILKVFNQSEIDMYLMFYICMDGWMDGYICMEMSRFDNNASYRQKDHKQSDTLSHLQKKKVCHKSCFWSHDLKTGRLKGYN